MAASHTNRADRIVIERGARRTAVSLPRHGVVTLALAFLLIVGWSLAAAAYMVFYDTVVAQIRHDARATAKGYETQIAAMRDELERFRTRRLVEKAGVDERIAELGRRQADLEKRQRRLAEIAPAATAEAAAHEAADISFGYPMKPTPIDAAGDSVDHTGAPPGVRRSAGDAVEKVKASLDDVEADQLRVVERIRSRTGERVRTLQQVYDAARLPQPAAGDGRGRGGPFEPLPEAAMSFESRVDRALAERAVVAAMEKGLERAPLRTPLPGSSVTSGFGARSDPFLGRPAFHGGLDFEGEQGSTVRATAAGKVAAAGWSGGYGNMVEIDHGDGLATRFGHLSSIAVDVGDDVRIGSVIGNVGSTGRSTGPHLHYETRVQGEAVDPLRFLNAGRILARAR